MEVNSTSINQGTLLGHQPKNRIITKKKNWKVPFMFAFFDPPKNMGNFMAIPNIHWSLLIHSISWCTLVAQASTSTFSQLDQGQGTGKITCWHINHGCLGGKHPPPRWARRWAAVLSVGGFSPTHLEKYEKTSNWEIFPNQIGVNIKTKYLSCHHPELYIPPASRIDENSPTPMYL